MKHAKAIFSILAIVSVVIFSFCNKASTTIDLDSIASGFFIYKVDGGPTINEDNYITKII